MRKKVTIVTYIMMVSFSGFVSAASSKSGSMTKQPNIVMANFVSHDNSYQSQQNADKLSELLQIVLMKKTSYDWVEREEIQRSIDELKLSMIGEYNNSASLQVGKWLNADILVKGDIFLKGGRWSLVIELIDLKHADIMFSKTFGLYSRGKGPFFFNTKTVSDISTRIVPLLEKACENIQENTMDLYVAPLFFQNKLPGGRLDFFENDLYAAIAKFDHSFIRFIQFPRAEDSINETELVIAGLTGADHDQWQQRADYYVWGSYEEIEVSGVPFEKVKVKVSVTVWDGRRKLGEFTETGEVSKLEELTERIITKICSYVILKASKSSQDSIRKEIAGKIFERASEMQELVLQIEYNNYSKVSSTWWKRREYVLELLSIASFLEPNNEKIRTALLVESTRDDIYFLEKLRDSLFQVRMRTSRQWGKHCEKFGFGYRHIQTPKLKRRQGLSDNRLRFGFNGATAYLNSVLDTVDSILKNGSGLAGYPPEVLVELEVGLGREFCRRLGVVCRQCPELLEGKTSDYVLGLFEYSDDTKFQVEVIETLWGGAEVIAVSWRLNKYVSENLMKIYSAQGKPERAEELIAMLPQKQTQAKAEVKISKDNDVVVPKPVANPNTHKITNSSIPLMSAKINYVSLGRYYFIQRVIALANVGNKLWISIHGQSVRNNYEQTAGLLIYDFSTRKFLDVSDKVGKGTGVTSILSKDNLVWTTFDGDGVWALNATNLKAKTFTTREGLMSDKAYCMSYNKQKLFIGGGIDERLGVLSVYDTKSGKIEGYDIPLDETDGEERYCHITEVASNEQWVAAYCHRGSAFTRILLLNLKTMKWTEICVDLLKEYPELSHFQKGERLFLKGLHFDKHGLWVVSSRGIALFNPDSMSIEYTCAFDNLISTFMADEGYLWVSRYDGAANGVRDRHKPFDCQITVFDTSAKKWLGRIKVPHEGRVSAISKYKNQLWLGVDFFKNSLVSVDISQLSLQGGSR